jgi:hypothetical protein
MHTFTLPPKIAGSSSTQSGGTFSEQPVMVGIVHLKNVNYAFSTGNIHAFVFGVTRQNFQRSLWIADHAKPAGLTLVTNNEREFERVPGLKLQNWSSRRRCSPEMSCRASSSLVVHRFFQHYEKRLLSGLLPASSRKPEIHYAPRF